MEERAQEFKIVKAGSNLGVLVWTAISIIIGQIANMSNSTGLLLIDLILVGIVSLFISEERILPFMLCLIAPNRILTYGPISAPTIIMMIGIFRNIKLAFKLEKQFFISIFGLICISIFTFFLGDAMLLDAIKIFVVLSFLRIYTDLDNIRYSYIKYVKYCALGCILSGIISLAINPSSISDAGRFSLSGSGENVLGILCATIILHFVTIAINEYQIRKSPLFIYSLILMGIGFLTGSRSFFLAIAIGMICLFLTILFKLDIRSLLKTLLICLVVVIFCYAVISSSEYIRDIFSKLIYRTNKLQNTDISNGRFSLWSQYLYVLNSNPVHLLFGGMNPSDYGINKVAHNMIIEQLASFGVIGSLFIISAYLSIFKYLRQNSGSKIKLVSAQIVPLIAFLGASMVSHTLLGVPQTMMLYLCAIGLFVSNSVED